MGKKTQSSSFNETVEKKRNKIKHFLEIEHCVLQGFISIQQVNTPGTPAENIHRKETLVYITKADWNTGHRLEQGNMTRKKIAKKLITKIF